MEPVFLVVGRWVRAAHRAAHPAGPDHSLAPGPDLVPDLDPTPGLDLVPDPDPDPGPDPDPDPGP